MRSDGKRGDAPPAAAGVVSRRFGRGHDDSRSAAPSRLALPVPATGVTTCCQRRPAGRQRNPPKKSASVDNPAARNRTMSGANYAAITLEPGSWRPFEPPVFPSLQCILSRQLQLCGEDLKAVRRPSFTDFGGCSAFHHDSAEKECSLDSALNPRNRPMQHCINCSGKVMEFASCEDGGQKNLPNLSRNRVSGMRSSA